MKNDCRALVIGGANYDITAGIKSEVVPADSNPARIYGSCGGVGRNIAENLARMGTEAAFLTAWGDDSFSAEIAASCSSVGLDVSRCVCVPGASSAIYMDILDSKGELILAASDLTVLEELPAKAFEDRGDYISGFSHVFLDANLLPHQLEAAAACAAGKLFADAVSVSKAPRLRSILPKLFALKVNRSELEILSGMHAVDEADMKAAAQKLLDCGVKRVYITFGADGSCCLSENGFFSCRAGKPDVKSVTGAGDAFAAAIMLADMDGMNEEQSLRLGTAAAELTLESPYAVSRDMSRKMLEERLDGFI